MKKILILGIIFVLIFVILCVGLKSPFSFEKILKNAKPEELTLTIYFRVSSGFPTYYLTLDELLVQGEKIVIKGKELTHLINTLSSIQKLNKPSEKSKYTDAEIYYVLENNNKGVLFDVLMTGIGNKNAFTTVFVNGTEYEDNNLLYEAIAPYIR